MARFCAVGSTYELRLCDVYTKSVALRVCVCVLVCECVSAYVVAWFRFIYELRIKLDRSCCTIQVKAHLFTKTIINKFKFKVRNHTFAHVSRWNRLDGARWDHFRLIQAKMYSTTTPCERGVLVRMVRSVAVVLAVDSDTHRNQTTEEFVGICLEWYCTGYSCLFAGRTGAFRCRWNTFRSHRTEECKLRILWAPNSLRQFRFPPPLKWRKKNETNDETEPNQMKSSLTSAVGSLCASAYATIHNFREIVYRRISSVCLFLWLSLSVCVCVCECVGERVFTVNGVFSAVVVVAASSLHSRLLARCYAVFINCILFVFHLLSSFRWPHIGFSFDVRCAHTLHAVADSPHIHSSIEWRTICMTNGVSVAAVHGFSGILRTISSRFESNVQCSERCGWNHIYTAAVATRYSATRNELSDASHRLRIHEPWPVAAADGKDEAKHKRKKERKKWETNKNA